MHPPCDGVHGARFYEASPLQPLSPELISQCGLAVETSEEP
jgi:hypothetical protein